MLTFDILYVTVSMTLLGVLFCVFGFITTLSCLWANFSRTVIWGFPIGARDYVVPVIEPGLLHAKHDFNPLNYLSSLL